MTRNFGIITSKSELSRRRLLDGGTNTVGGSQGDKYASPNAIRFPAASLPANLAPLLQASFYSRVQQALVDSFALLFCVCFVVTLLLSVPLAVFLLFFASF